MYGQDSLGSAVSIAASSGDPSSIVGYDFDEGSPSLYPSHESGQRRSVESFDIAEDRSEETDIIDSLGHIPPTSSSTSSSVRGGQPVVSLRKARDELFGASAGGNGILSRQTKMNELRRRLAE